MQNVGYGRHWNNTITTSKTSPHQNITRSNNSIQVQGRKQFNALGSNWWKLTIDKNRHHEGPDAFESEKGYRKAMENGFNLMLDTLGEKITSDSILQFHDTCVDGVSIKISERNPAVLSLTDLNNKRNEMNNYQSKHHLPDIPDANDFDLVFNDFSFTNVYDTSKEERTYIGPGIADPRFQLKEEFRNNPILNEIIDNALAFPKGFRPEGAVAQYDITLSGPSQYGTEEGIMEIERQCVKEAHGAYASFGSITRKEDKEIAYTWKSASMSEETIRGHIDNAIDDYYRTIEHAESETEILYAITDLCQFVERLHPFSDANGRTNAQLLLNKCLLENGFPLVILNNPNHLDGFSRDQFIQEIRDGFVNYQDSIPQKDSHCTIF